MIIGTLLFPSISSAQQTFTPLQEGDYEIKDENIFFNPGIIVEGSYEAYYSAIREDFITGDKISDGLLQDIELRIRSKVNTNLSVHAYIGNKSKVVSEQDDRFQTDYADEGGDATDDSGGMDLEFREAFLEYNHNPNAALRVGKQFINPGDRMGLIYEGNANAITQKCRIGTWCYYIGGARIGHEGNSALFWLQLDYPVYESGVVISDPWVEKGTRQQVSLNVELMRVDHRGSDIPMSVNGQWIGEYSTHHDVTTDGSTTKYIYFENDEVQYLGFNLHWNYYKTMLRLSWVNLSGKRDYWMKAKDAGREALAGNSIAGNAVYLDISYQLLDSLKVGWTSLSSSGTEREDGEKFWENNSESYLEVQKGDFGDALIYFNGKDGLGQGHSVSNLVYNAMRASYISDDKKLKMLFAVYTFKRAQPVFYKLDDGTTQTATDIGSEIDFVLDWKWEDDLTAGFQLAAFSPGNAYSANDNIQPQEGNKGFSLIGINLRYEF